MNTGIMGMCVATTKEEADALYAFMMEQTGMSAPKPNPAPKKEIRYEYVICDYYTEEIICVTDNEDAAIAYCDKNNHCEYDTVEVLS